nr:uncharacterized protein LOC103349190 isoform X2 [Oryctolagus cuniculus]
MFSVGNGSRVSLFILVSDFCSFDFCRYIFICAPLVSLPGSPGRGRRIPRPESHPGWGLPGAGLTAVPQALCVPSGSRVPQQSGAGGVMAAPGARAEKAVRWDRGCLHRGGRKCCYCEMEPAGDFQLWRLCLQGRGSDSGAPLSCAQGLCCPVCGGFSRFKTKENPETRSAPARRLPMEGPLGAAWALAVCSSVLGSKEGKRPRKIPAGWTPRHPSLDFLPFRHRFQMSLVLVAPRTGPRGFSGCPQVTMIVHRKMDSETPSFGILALPEKGLNVPYPRCHKERTTCLSSCPQVTTIVLRKMDSNSPRFRALALPEEVLNVPRPHCPKDDPVASLAAPRSPRSSVHRKTDFDTPSFRILALPEEVLMSLVLAAPRTGPRGCSVPGEQLLPGKNFVASVGAQGLPCSTASVPAMNRFMSLTETS